jgi:cyclopropane-fatty-acyl-phospholipid synthase
MIKETTIPSRPRIDRMPVQAEPSPRAVLRGFRLVRNAVFGRLARLQKGMITIVDDRERRSFGRLTPDCSLHATVTILDPRTYLDVAVRGTVGVGDAYQKGLWNCDDLTTLIRIFVLNREVLNGMERGLAWITKPLLRAAHWWNRNTHYGSRKNIAAHYDIGNEFFRLMLDEMMMYSCAYFERPDTTLAEASRAKNDRICCKLQLSPRDHLLEIGTGWGGFALHAASRYGCRVTTTTISQQQYELAIRRIREAGLSSRVVVLLSDYRDLPNIGAQFDKLVSIEMIEAVGHQYYGTFFDICGRMLKPSGVMLLQAITMDERIYEQATRSVDFIQKYIFPGSCIPSISALTGASAETSDLSLLHMEDIGAHYAPTLRAWRKNLADALSQVKALGYEPEFLRLWDFYLSYCEGGFMERSISAAQLLFAKSDWRPTPVGISIGG